MEVVNLTFDKHELRRFESLGDNCELGMVLRSLGSENSGMFRWALAKLPATIKAIQTSFSGLYEKPNIVPHSKIMVRDIASGIAYHSDLRSDSIDGDLFFKESGDTWDAKFRREKGKFRYLADKFTKRLNDRETIFIVKCNVGIPQDQAKSLYKALCDKAGHKVNFIHVQKRMPGHTGDFHRINDNLAVGYIDRFAPYANADDSLKQQWHAIMRHSLNAFS